MVKILDTGIKVIKNVDRVLYGENAFNQIDDVLTEILNRKKIDKSNAKVIYLIDEYFSFDKKIELKLPTEISRTIKYINTSEEPKTETIDLLVDLLRSEKFSDANIIVGIGGGVTLDTAKAVSNLFTNPGKAENYQGWDLLNNPGVFKVGVPTISGTGAEATRTCVMTNSRTGLKLGMNSDFSVFDYVILDPSLTATVSRNQYFYTGMDAYLHCIEATSGAYRNPIGDALSVQAIKLCKDVFLSKDMMSGESRRSLMVASYLGGLSIATTYVGMIHPFSAGLSVVLGIHHCEANCIVMRGMKEFYPNAYDEFWSMVKQNSIYIPEGVCRDLDEDQYRKLYDATVVHKKPLTNALGEDFDHILTPQKVKEIFLKM